MAIFTSVEKCFEVTALAFTPAVVAFGEEASYSITVKNISGKKISSMYAGLRLFFKDSFGTVRGSTYEYMYGGPAYAMKAISWASGASQTFTGKFKVYSNYDVSKETRQVPIFRGGDAGYTTHADEPLGLMLDFTTNADFSFGGNYDQFYNLRGVNSEYLKVFDSRYAPSIPKFSAERSNGSTPDDEGENLLAGIRLALTDDTYADRLKLQLRWRDKALGGEYAGEDLSADMQAALARETIVPVTGPFGKNSDWELVLRYGDEYEAAEASLLLSRAFANVHLSGASTGGVCFGSFSKATEGCPLFQNYYPSEFYEPARFDKGIHGISNFALGEVETGGRWIDGKKIYRRVIAVNVTTTGALTEIADVPGVAAMVNMYGYVTRASGTQRFPLAFWFSTSNYHSFMLDGNKLGVKTSAVINGYVIIEYTKTSEEASN